MTGLFYTILEMSISASILVLVVLLLRLIFKKAPKWISVLLWGLVAVRLVLPFTIESPLSLMPHTDWFENENFGSEDNFIYDNEGDVTVPDVIPPDAIIPGGSDKTETDNNLIIQFPATEPDIVIREDVSPGYIINAVWLSGVALMLMYIFVSYIFVYRRIRGSEHFRDNIYMCKEVNSPFVFGIAVPRIYLPENMDAVSMSYVIAHEEAHVRRRDHWWKPIGFILLAVHWFNPIIWLAYILLCRDIEMACDERVIREMGERERVDYSEALLDCSVSRRIIAACPLAFGENNVKERIKSVLNYKKPAFWLIIAAVVVCVATAACFLTDPQTNDDADTLYARHGIALSLPESFRQDAVTVKSPNELPDNTIAEFYQTAVLDYCGGWIFSVVRHDEGNLVPNEVNTGSIYYFAHDDAYWYAIKSPTDLQTDPTSEELGDEYEMLTSQRDELIRLIMENNPSLVSTSNADVSEYVKNKQNVEASSIKEGFGANRIKIKHINSNSQLVNVTLGINLPKEWTINYDYQSYEMIPFAEYADLKNGSDYVGGIGFLTYDLHADQADIPEAIFNQIAMGSTTFWNIRQHFDLVTAEDSPYRTALTSVLYSSKAFQDGKERSNSGIVSYHPEYKMYIALQLTDGTKDRSILSEEGLCYVAESIEWIDVEFSDTGADATGQSELFKKTVDFLAQEYHAVYDPYYQILNLAIFDWNESGNEATFRYTVTQQYWNRDPDTVDYIKAAKDDPERYEMMCKDYLAPKESNFYFKVVLNGDEIELYSNESPTGVEWKPRKIADYLPKQSLPITITEVNRDNVMEHETHEYIHEQSEYTRYFLISVRDKYTNVRITSMMPGDTGIEIGDSLYTLPELTSQKSLLIGVVFYGDTTAYGLLLTDANGVDHQYMICVSGEDGSVILQELPYVEDSVAVKNIITSLDDYKLLGPDFYESYYEYTRALLSGDTAKMEELSMYSEGTYDCYKGVTFTFKSITKEPETGRFILTAEVSDGHEVIPGGTQRFYYCEYERLCLEPILERPAPNATEASANLSRLLNTTMEYDLDKMEVTEYIIDALYRKTEKSSFTEDEIVQYAKRCFGIEDFTPDQRFKNDGAYGSLAHGGNDIYHDIISTDYSSENGVSTVTVRFYGDRAKTVCSHLIKYQMKKLDGDWVFIGQKIVEKRALEPQRFAH